MPSPNRLILSVILTNDQGKQTMSFDTKDYLTTYSGKDVALYPIEIRLLRDIITLVTATQRYHRQENPDAIETPE